MEADLDCNELKTILALLKLDEKHLNIYSYILQLGQFLNECTSGYS